MSYLGKTPVDVVDALNVQSLTVDNNLTVDTDTLVVDSTNNRVGIGTSSPTVQFETNSNGFGHRLEGVSANNYSIHRFVTDTSDTDKFIIGYGASHANAHQLAIKAGNAAGTIGFYTAGIERMRIDSSGLDVTGSLTQSAGLVPNYDSGYVSFGGTSTTTVSHGLGTRPSICIITMYCNSSNAGYSTGDELVVCHDDGDGGRRHIGYWNSSQVKMRWNNAGMVTPTVGISNWSAGSWRYRVRCWK